MRIGVDLMGGDQPPQAIFEAALQVSQELPVSSSLVVFAHHEVLSLLKKQYLAFFELREFKPTVSFEFITTEQVIEKEDAPLLAVRRKKNSSMSAGIRLLKEGYLDAFVSTGNTGALIALAMFHLPKLPGIERPALLVVLPAGKKGVVVLDVGANISCKPHHLIDYAKMGIVYRQCMQKVKYPTVGLLNIGTEQEKGTQSVKEAYQTLSDHFRYQPTPFLGNIEAREVFRGGKVDVLVTDGFTGNVFLKTCEGVSSFLIDYLQDHFGGNGARGMKQVMSHLQGQFNYSQHPGAILCGVEGLVIKCHGYSDIPALMNGIRGAHQLVKRKFIQKMKTHLAQKKIDG